MLRLDGVTLSFGERALLHDVTWAVRDRDRVGLVGANGSGKTTLMRIAAGMQEVDGGTIQLTRGRTVGYLPQEGVILRDGGVMALVREARTDLVELERRIASHFEALDEADDRRRDEILGKLQRDQDAFDIGGGYRVEAEAGRVLRGLGFGKETWERPVSTFSRGWQMRIALAQLLMQRPSFMLLDEPTNHLDMESRAWLERFLDEYEGSVVVVSHDRHFLDRVVERVAEVEAGAVTEFAGNFTSYEAHKAASVQRLTNAAARQTREVARIQQFISRFRYDKRRARQVQSRIRMLEKMERLEVGPVMRHARFAFPEAPRCGSPVLTSRTLGKRYGGRAVLGGVDLEVSRGERVAIAGPNGAGKSTLMRLLAGREHPDEGEVRLGHNVVVAYFAQDQLEEMDAERTVMQELALAAPGASEERLRGLLGTFLFEGDDVHKPVGVLSGGESNRLALAKVLVAGANLLLLDEPTNHLDMSSKEVLLGALEQFGGTVAFVSHDRHFVEALADRVVAIEEGHAETYPGTFEDFLWKKAREVGFEGERVPGVPAPDLWLLSTVSQAIPEESAPALGGESYRDRVRHDRAVQRKQREVARTMSRIEELEEQVSTLYRQMERPEVAVDVEQVITLQAEVDERRSEIGTLYARWEELQEELEDG